MNEKLIGTAFDSFVNSQLASVIGWTLVHFFWQGLLIGGIGWVVLKLLGRASSADTRYLTACGLLVLMPLATLGTGTFLVLNNQSSPTIASLENKDDIENTAAVEFTTSDRVLERSETDQTNERLTFHLPDSDESYAIADGSSAVEPPPERLPLFKERLSTFLEPFLPALVILWIVGVLFLSLRLLATWARVQWIKKTGRLVSDQRLSNSVQAIRRRLGIDRVVDLLESASVEVPTVIGWLKPAILLPVSALSGLSNTQIEAILAHELAHIRRADYIVNLLQSIVETVLFFHPAVWWISHQLRTERENCCDDFAAEYCGNTKQYAFALLKMEQLRPQPKHPNELALGADGGSLVNRVARLIGKQPAKKDQTPYGIAAISALTFVSIFAFTLVVNFQPSVAAATPTSEIVVQDKTPDGKDIKPKDDLSGFDWPKEITVKVVDPNGKPMSGVGIHRSVWSKDRTFPANDSGTTDDKGEFKTKLPDRFYILRLWASESEHVPLFANWEQQDIEAGKLPPKVFTFKMIAGSEIGGFIKNDKGNPIIGARVEVRCSVANRGSTLSGSAEPRISGTLAYGSAAAVTDENGYWKLNNAPEESASFTATVRHPDYIDDSRAGELQLIAGLQPGDFRKKSGVIVMQRGVRVTGTLKNLAGKPVEQALVVFGDRPYWDAGSQEVKTDSNGTFEFPPLPMGETRFTVMAEGYRPESEVIEVTHMMDPVDFELVDGKTIKIQFVDQDDKPIPQAYVGVEKWRGVESIYNHQHPNVIDSKIPFRAGPGGVYIWDWAPEDEITFNFGQLGYTSKRGVKFSASDKTHVVKLFSALSISGDVVDKTTGKPIKKFTVVPWKLPLKDSAAKQQPAEMQHARKPGHSGRFSVDLDTEGKFQVRVQAEGYKIAESDWYKIGETVPRLKFELEPTAWLEGLVVDKAGTPIEAAEIQIASAEKTVSICDYVYRYTGRERLQTDAEGKFKLPKRDQPYTLMVLTNNGYAEVAKQPAEDIGKIVLSKWGRIEGTVLNEKGKPAANVKVGFEGIRYQNGLAWHIYDLSTVTTDKEGKYFFSRVPAGMDVAVSPLTHMTDQLKTKTNKVLTIEAGKTSQANFGEGVEVKGRIKLSGSPFKNVRYDESRLTTLPVSKPNFRIAELEKIWSLKKGTPVENYEQFSNSFDYHLLKAMKNSQEYHQTTPSFGGTFRMMVDEPGEYEMLVYVQVHHPESDGYLGAPIGRKIAKFTVTDADLKKGKLDVGEIEVQAKKSHKIGETILDFEFKNENEVKRQTSEFKDQYVLIDFYVPWCKVCEKDTSKVQELVKSIGERGLSEKVTVLSLEGQDGSGPTKRAPAGSTKGWINGKLYPESGSGILSSLGVWSMPRYLLIDPDRKLLYHGSIDGVEKALDQIKSP